MFQYLLQGFLLGLAYVAPIGTQNLFVINTALTQRRQQVLACALIVAFFDITLSLACFYGVGLIISTSVWLELAIISVGSLVVIKIGIDLLRSHATAETGSVVAFSVKKVITTACVVTWFNPQALIDGSMLLGASKAAVPGEYGTAFICGCALASLGWWLGMSMTVNTFRTKITPKLLQIINLACGAFIVFYGLKLLYSGVQLALEL